jgi:hypothetical protein
MCQANRFAVIRETAQHNYNDETKVFNTNTSELQSGVV